MIYWAPVLHFYQPPGQLPFVLRQIAQECYRPLLEVFRQHPHARATVNICGVLSELLYDHGLADVLQGLGELGRGGQVEFTGSAKYHAILPLLPRAEVERQIRLNYQANRHFLGQAYAPQGFFAPELAYSPEIIGPVAASGHHWLLLAGLACPTPWPLDVIYQAGQGQDGLSVFFRDDILSNKVSFRGIDAQGFVRHLRSLGEGGRSAYVITAQDAETFGHHIKRWERLFLGRAFRAVGQHIQMVTVSQLRELFPLGSRVEARTSSWSTSEQDLAAGNPYPLWRSPHNALHQWQWEHLHLALDLVRRAERLARSEEGRRHARIARSYLDRAWHSCQFWWASGPPRWDINLVNRGLAQQQEAVLNAYRALVLSDASPETKRACYNQVLACRGLAGKIQDGLLAGPREVGGDIIGL